MYVKLKTLEKGFEIIIRNMLMGTTTGTWMVFFYPGPRYIIKKQFFEAKGSQLFGWRTAGNDFHQLLITEPISMISVYEIDMCKQKYNMYIYIYRIILLYIRTSLLCIMYLKKDYGSNIYIVICMYCRWSYKLLCITQHSCTKLHLSL